MALKWYFLQNANDKQRDIINKLIEIKAPDNRFLWPKKFIEFENKKSFGYIMPLRPRFFSNIVDLMKRKIEPSFDALVNGCIQLTDSFHKLHKKNLCYKDISFSNVFIHPYSGDIIILDNDNVTVSGSDIPNVLGTPKFMAPEVVLYQRSPDIYSDRFSLCILLFYMLMMHHPFEGAKETKIKCLDLFAMTELYGKNPIFIFDPDNATNRPIKNLHDNAIIFWNIYPNSIKRLFIEMFTKGIRDIINRPSEEKIRKILVELKNSITICSCGAENFYDREKLINNKEHICWNCNKKIPLKTRIKIGDEIIILNLSTKLYEHHLTLENKYSFKHSKAEVIYHPKHRDVIALKNLSKKTWRVKDKLGVIEILPNDSALLNNNTEIDFGDIKGIVRRG